FVVEVGTATADGVEFIDAGDEDEFLLSGLFRLYFGGEDGFGGSVGLREESPVRGDDLAAPNEARAALLSDAVAGDDVDTVFPGAGARQEVRRALCALRPVRRDEDDVRSAQRQRARRLREAHIVADQDADAGERQINDGQFRAPAHEAVYAQHGQMRFAIVRDQAARPGDERAVVERARRVVSFQQPDDRMNPQLPTGRADGLCRLAGYRLGGGQRLLGAVEDIAGQRALREDDQLRARPRRLPQPRQNRFTVLRPRAEARLHLHGSDPKGVCHSSTPLMIRRKRQPSFSAARRHIVMRLTKISKYSMTVASVTSMISSSVSVRFSLSISRRDF